MNILQIFLKLQTRNELKERRRANCSTLSKQFTTCYSRPKNLYAILRADDAQRSLKDCGKKIATVKTTEWAD